METPRTQRARIVGKVEYREGDGANMTIRPGPCEVVETALDVTISWTDEATGEPTDGTTNGPTNGSTAIPLADYHVHLANHAIEVDGPKAG